MNYVYVFTDDNYLEITRASLKSLRKVCNPHIIIAHYGKEDVSDLGEVIKVKKEHYVNRRMTCKIEYLAECIKNLIGLEKMLCLDTDLVFKKDPFEIFKNDGDIFVTTNSYKSKFPINAGVWGFVGWRNGFVIEYAEQLNIKTDAGFVDYMKKFNHTGQDWYVDQDYLCTMYERGYAVDAGSEWNYCVKTGTGGYDEYLKDAINRFRYDDKKILARKLKKKIKNEIRIRKEYRAALKNPDINIVHFKCSNPFTRKLMRELCADLF